MSGGAEPSEQHSLSPPSNVDGDIDQPPALSEAPIIQRPNVTVSSSQLSQSLTLFPRLLLVRNFSAISGFLPKRFDG